VQEIVEQALGTYELTSKMDAAELARSRDRIARYLDKLISAGQDDPHQLTEYARAYLKEMYEGPDPRFTGC
jgi:streptomycin 6-kinase